MDCLNKGKVFQATKIWRFKKEQGNRIDIGDDANNIIKVAARHIDGGGGGKKHFAKAGGKDLKLLEKAILRTKKEVFKDV